MTRPFLTVLTVPAASTTQWLYQRVRSAVRPVVKPGVPLPASSRYPGHYAVVRSVVEGLNAIGADFTFNPPRISDIGRVVYAPANEALRQAAELKRRGAIDFLAAGPVNALFPDEAGGVLRMPEIDLLIVPSDWVLEFYADAPDLRAKAHVCPCGVDAAFWTPTAAKEDVALVYWKSGSEAFCEEVEAVVARAGLRVERLRSRPGETHHFDAADYRRRLNRARLAVFISAFETQGVALAEAWSMNVPTLVWDPQADTEWSGQRFRARSSAPYLTPSTGIAWRTLDDLSHALDRMGELNGTFSPRDWVLANMTDAVCAGRLYRILRTATDS